MKNIVVVGSGFSGSIIARKIADELGFNVKVIEQRNHIAGNMFDEIDHHGILVQKYGPHVLVTNKWSIIDYLSKYSEMFQYTVKELSFMDNKYVRLPFNFESVQQLIGYAKAEVVINKLREQYQGRDRVPILELVNSHDKDISAFGTLLFEKSYRTYCAKQWDVPIEKLDVSIMNRVPMAMSYDERYMNKDFQFLPKNGFSELFKNLLDHENITIQLNTDANEHIKFDFNKKTIFFDDQKIDLLVYTGALDELFNLKFGELPYRSLNIEYEWQDTYRLYPEAIISFPQAKGYTRKTEYKFMMLDHSNTKGTTIATEYPTKYIKNKSIAPFYPVITEETQERYIKYCNEAKLFDNLFFCGRLADFKYYNMDDCILRAFDVFESIKKYLLDNQ